MENKNCKFAPRKGEKHCKLGVLPTQCDNCRAYHQ